MSQDARRACIKAVGRCLQGEDLQQALTRVLDRSGLKEADKGLVTKISYGYLRHKKGLEFILARTVSGKLKKLPFPLVLRLGLALYELLHLERVPEYATVHWYVENVKQEVSPRLSGLANAVLRQVVRSGDQVLEPDFYWHGTSSRATFWGRYYSCPKWIVDLWRESYGEKACLRLLQESLRPPHVGVRVNRTLPEAEQLYFSLAEEADLTLTGDFGLALQQTPARLGELEQQGQLTRQSFAAQLVMSQLDPRSWPAPVWEVCAGRGGKTTALAESTSKTIWAGDLSLDKLRGLRAETSRLLLPRVPCFVHDGASGSCLRRPASTVFIDAPCSGLGVLSRRPDIKWKREPREVKRLERIQQDILHGSLQSLSPGGWLIYVTCTLNLEENEAAIERFRQESGDRMRLHRSWCPVGPGINEYFYAALLQKQRD